MPLSPMPWRTLSRGTIAAACVLALAGLAVSGPLAAVVSPRMVYPIARMLPLKVTEAARGATIAALEMDGYVMTPTVSLAE
jgi:hypothetical protein